MKKTETDQNSRDKIWLSVCSGVLLLLSMYTKNDNVSSFYVGYRICECLRQYQILGGSIAFLSTSIFLC